MKIKTTASSDLPDAYQVAYNILSRIPYLKRTDYPYYLAQQFHDTLLGFLITRFFKMFDSEDIIIVEYHDTWNCDHTLSKIIVPLLREYKKNLSGHPCYIDDEDVPEHLRHTPEDEMNSNCTEESWLWIINEMEWAFQQKLTDWEEQYTTREVLDDDGTLFPRRPLLGNKLYRYHFDEEGIDVHQQRMNNGFRLFARYFESLWN